MKKCLRIVLFLSGLAVIAYSLFHLFDSIPRSEIWFYLPAFYINPLLFGVTLCFTALLPFPGKGSSGKVYASVGIRIGSYLLPGSILAAVVAAFRDAHSKSSYQPVQLWGYSWRSFWENFWLPLAVVCILGIAIYLLIASKKAQLPSARLLRCRYGYLAASILILIGQLYAIWRDTFIILGQFVIIKNYVSQLFFRNLQFNIWAIPLAVYLLIISLTMKRNVSEKVPAVQA